MYEHVSIVVLLSVRARTGNKIPWGLFIDTQCQFWEMKLGPLEENQALLNTDPPLQPQILLSGPFAFQQEVCCLIEFLPFRM